MITVAYMNLSVALHLVPSASTPINNSLTAHKCKLKDKKFTASSKNYYKVNKNLKALFCKKIFCNHNKPSYNRAFNFFESARILKRRKHSYCILYPHFLHFVPKVCNSCKTFNFQTKSCLLLQNLRYFWQIFVTAPIDA